ncbi:peptidyl-prolyl cis-trans isomerase B (rotamase B) (fragment) [Carnobacterium maltaromaticum]
MDVVDKIAAVEVGQSDKPKEDIKIEKINVIQEAK